MLAIEPKALGAELLKGMGVGADDIDKAVQFLAHYGGRIDLVLQTMGAINEEQLAQFRSAYFQYPLLLAANIDKENITTVKKALLESAVGLSFLSRHRWLPFAIDGEKNWHIITDDPADLTVLQWLAMNGQRYKLYCATSDTINELMPLYADTESAENSAELGDVELSRLKEMALEAPTVNLVNTLINRSLAQRASDLHIEPVKGRLRARVRVDGVLQDLDSIPLSIQLAVVSRIKILAGMDIAERRRPQDGKIALRTGGKEIDIRVSILPVADGESVVMRFLVKESISHELEVVGISADIVERLLHDISRTAGVILVTGPTGSGKTTTLYAVLNRLNKPGVKIITLEDPVEYRLNGINQLQVQSDIGLTFASGLRSIVRQDPDIIMVGEIRDQDTASIAMQSALTGHLVFSTLHTNDAPSAYTRLLDLGVERFLLNAALVSILAQRLVRVLCSHCREPDPQHEDVMQRFDLAPIAERFGLVAPQICRPKGCDKCEGSGFHGRVAIVEYFPCDAHVAALEKGENFLAEARKYQTALGLRDLKHDGFLKVLQGQTTIAEVLRVAG